LQNFNVVGRKDDVVAHFAVKIKKSHPSDTTYTVQIDGNDQTEKRTTATIEPRESPHEPNEVTRDWH
jgi:hypothetical protein